MMKHPRLLLLVGLAIAAVFALMGHPVIPPEALAALSFMPLAIGEVGMEGLTDLLKKQGVAFEEFKKANDDRLKSIEGKGYAPSDVVAKVDKINDDLTELGKQIGDIAKKSNRPAEGKSALAPEKEEHKQAFRSFLRKGDANGLANLERKAFQMGSDVDGGFLIDEEMVAEIDRVAITVSAMRGLADVRTIGKASLEFRVKTSGTAARWVGEAEAGGETTNPKYAQLEIVANEMEVEPWAYNSALDDADFDVVSDITSEAGIGFGEGEGVAFINGNGIKKPRGILSYDMVANANYVWGKVGYLASGAAGAFAASNPSDKIIDLLHSLRATYRNGATLLMADTTLAEVRKIKDGSGNFYLFNPDPTGKFTGFVLGAPVEIDDNMPVLAANSLSIAYANFQRAYRIVDRKGIALIRDNITTKGTTKFNFRRRVGGGIRNFEAIKVMKFA
jgi:HK97 family phage major capsid protein